MPLSPDRVETVAYLVRLKIGDTEFEECARDLVYGDSLLNSFSISRLS